MATEWGEPDDVDGECNAHCYIADNYGDGRATMRCQLPKGHELPHREEFRQGTSVLTWEHDERCYHDKGSHTYERTGDEMCDECGANLTRAKERRGDAAG